MDNLKTIPEFIELNNQQLEKINIRGIKSRIKNDCNVLYKDYEVLIDVIERGEITIYVVEHIRNYNSKTNKTSQRTYKFILTTNYPFHPPKIFVNEQPYANLLRIQGDYQKDMVKKMRGQDCLCCHSLNCSVNWSPAIKLHRIIDEIKDTIKFKRDIINLLLADKIKKKYNIPYAYIELYLCLINTA